MRREIIYIEMKEEADDHFSAGRSILISVRTIDNRDSSRIVAADRETNSSRFEEEGGKGIGMVEDPDQFVYRIRHITES